MSITKLKTVGDWQPPRRRDGAPVEGTARIRGRIITGMLTGGDPGSEDPVAAHDQGPGQAG
jgi:hypothetical protein